MAVIFSGFGRNATTEFVPTVIFHEIAWMGTGTSAHQQWLELYNAGDTPVKLDGWTLQTESGSVHNRLSGTLQPGHIYLVARPDDDSFSGITIHHELQGYLSPEGEILKLYDDQANLVDRVDQWYAGDAKRAATMQRVYPYQKGDRYDSWKSSTIRYDNGYGTPGFRRPPPDYGQEIYYVYHGPNTINIFFNQSALIELALEGNEANHRINLEERIIDRIRSAQQRIDVTAYEINLPEMIDALMERAAAGIHIRLLLDAKVPTDDKRDHRYARMRLHLENMMRGRDGELGTDDSIHVFANSPIFAVADPDMREDFGLPRDPGRDLERVEVQIGSRRISGYILTEGERRGDKSYYSPSSQMHNKFILIDDYRVLTGSMNFTETGVYGGTRDRLQGRIRGNSNNLLDIHSPEITAIYREEFNQMWGSETMRPDPDTARFHGRKEHGRNPHHVNLGGIPVRVYFSPGYDVVRAIAEFVEQEARESVYFSIFAWSDSELENILKRKWEGSPYDLDGDPTGFRIKGVFERLFWNQWWSANINMEGREASRSSARNPNIRWRNPPPVFRDREARKLHHKYMLIDADTTYDPTVITGSANWSRNANDINDENSLFIHDRRIANQYLQEFYARYVQAGGAVYQDAIPRYVAAGEN